MVGNGNREFFSASSRGPETAFEEVFSVQEWEVGLWNVR
jgi:hypothetical protein